MEPNRSIIVFGAGAVGGFLGGALASVPGYTVTLLGRDPLVRAVQARGLIVRAGDVESVTHPRVASSTDDLPPADLVLLTVRSYDLEQAILPLRTLVRPGGYVLAWQNGVGPEQRLADSLGRERILPATLTVSCGVGEHGLIHRHSRGGGVALSSMNGKPVPSWVVAAFVQSALPTIEVQRYRSLRWSKLLLNMLGGATSAILDMDMRSLMSDTRVFRLEQLAFRETVNVMDIQSIRAIPLPGYPVPLVKNVMRLPHRLAGRLLGPRLSTARGGHSPSIRADVARGRTEIATLNGAVVRAAAELGVSAPVNAALTDLVESLTHDPQERTWFRGKPEELVNAMRLRGIGL